MTDLFQWADTAQPKPKKKARAKVRATSREAYAEIQPQLGRLQAQVLDFIKSTGSRGATILEMVEGLPMPSNVLCPRRIELEAMALIKNSGVLRENRSGRKAIVWIAT